MPSHVSTPHAAKPSRFFALTVERLEAIQRHRLTRADIQVWAHVELNARPRQPVAFTLEGIANRLELGVDTVRRSVRRLLAVRLLVGLFEGNRYRLAPATSPFEATANNLASVQGSTEQDLADLQGNDHDQAHENLAPVQGDAADNLIGVQGIEADKQGAAPDSATLQTSCSEKKESFLCPLGEALVRDWGLYAAVAARMVTTYGEDRVRQVMLWGDHLKATGKLKSRGWVYQALERGWAVPDTFNATRQEAVEGRRNERRVSQDPPKDEQVRMVRWHLSRKDEAMRVEGRRLAGLWGIELDSCLGFPAV